MPWKSDLNPCTRYWRGHVVGELQTFTAFAGDTQYLCDQDSEGLLSDSNDCMLHLIPALGAPLGPLSIFTFSPNRLPCIFPKRCLVHSSLGMRYTWPTRAISTNWTPVRKQDPPKSNSQLKKHSATLVVSQPGKILCRTLHRLRGKMTN